MSAVDRLFKIPVGETSVVAVCDFCHEPIVASRLSEDSVSTRCSCPPGDVAKRLKELAISLQK